MTWQFALNEPRPTVAAIQSRDDAFFRAPLETAIPLYRRIELIGWCATLLTLQEAAEEQEAK